jgi:hypothetical protein
MLGTHRSEDEPDSTPGHPESQGVPRGTLGRPAQKVADRVVVGRFAANHSSTDTARSCQLSPPARTSCGTAQVSTSVEDATPLASNRPARSSPDGRTGLASPGRVGAWVRFPGVLKPTYRQFRVAPRVDSPLGAPHREHGHIRRLQSGQTETLSRPPSVLSRIVPSQPSLPLKLHRSKTWCLTGRRSTCEPIVCALCRHRWSSLSPWRYGIRRHLGPVTDNSTLRH